MYNNLVLTHDQAKEIDRLCVEEFGIPSILLMENAGLNSVDYFLNLQPKGLVIICCGKGNNGGDGLVMARHLDNHNVSVHVLLFANPQELTVDAKINYNIALHSKIKMTIIEPNQVHSLPEYLSKGDWIVDALFGTGLQGNIQAPFDIIIRCINNAAKKVLSIDIPSGLDCDTGKILGVAIQATYTITMVGLKKGFLMATAKEYLGQIHIVDIAAPRVLTERLNKRSVSKS